MALSGGRFAMAWSDNTDGLGDFELRTAIFDATGRIEGSVRTIDDATYGRAITPLPNGGYAVAYRQMGENKLAFFGHDGALTTTETVGTPTEDLRGITALNDGSVLSVVMTYPTPTSSAITAYLRQTNGQTKAIALAEFEGSSDMVEVITLANSNVVVWCEDNALKARIVSSQGNVLGGEITLHQANSGSLEELKVEALPEGGFAAAFVSRSSEEGIGTDVYLGVYSANGTAVEAPSVVGRTTTGSQSIPSIAVMRDGRFVGSWNDMDDQAMHFQAYDPRTKGVSVSGDDASDRFVGTAFNDALRGGGGADRLRGEDGNDMLDGGVGADLMAGGAGNDTYHVDDAGDQVVEAHDQGVDHVITTVTRTLSDAVENLTAIGAAAVTLSGNGLDNTITGNAGNNQIQGYAGDDRLDGGAGADTLDGGLGDDTFYIDRADDLVVEGVGGGVDTVVVNTASYALSASAEVETLVAMAGTLSLRGSNTANAITSNSLSNSLWGLAGDDRIVAGAGDDKIYGGLGNDILHGQGGKDIFVFDTRTNKRTNVDRIEDFRYQDDSIYLENKIFTKLGKGASKGVKLKKDMFVKNTTAQDRDDRIIYDKKTGDLYYDRDGTGSKAQVKIATFTNKATLKYSDFFVI